MTMPEHRLKSALDSTETGSSQLCVLEDTSARALGSHISLDLHPDDRITRQARQDSCTSSGSPESRLPTSSASSGINRGQASGLQTKVAMPSPVVELARLLTEPASEELPLSIDTLCNLYIAAKDRSHLNRLSSAHFSTFVNILGSLSLSSPPVKYRSLNCSPLLDNMTPESFREHWSFLIQVIQDKEQIGAFRRTLGRSDRYWLMRAHLGRATSLCGGDSTQLSDTVHHLDAARHQYRRIRFEGAHPDVHVPYLRALLMQREAHHLDEAVNVLSEQLSIHERCHGALLAVLWDMALSSDILLSDSQKSNILKALRIRLGSRARNTEEPSPSKTTVTVRQLSAGLYNTLFSPTTYKTHMTRTLMDWAYSTCRTVFTHTDQSIQEQWHCLVLLGVVSMSTLSASSQIAGTLSGKPSNLLVADLQVVCALQHFESVLQSMDGAEDGRDVFHNILTILWRNWSGATSIPSSTRRKEFLRIVCGTFFVLAGRVKCRSVAESCHEFCIAEGVYESLSPESDPALSGRTRLLAEQLAAFVLCGMRISTALTVASDTTTLTGPDSHLHEGLSAIVAAAISLCSRHNPERAHKLQISAHRMGLGIPADILSAVGIDLADSGHIYVAVEYLADLRMSVEERAKVLSAVLSVLERQSEEILSSRFVGHIGDAMAEIYASSLPEEEGRQSLQCALLTMAKSGHERCAVQLIETISDNGPSYFEHTSPAFWTNMLSALLYHRQFLFARRICKLAARFHPRHMVRWQRMLLLQFARGGAWALASRMSREVDPRVWPSLSLLVARQVKFQERPPRRALTLRIPLLLASRQHTSNTRDRSFATTYAMKLLVRAGRMRLTKKLYADTVKEGMGDANTRTIMGNEILHGNMMRRSKRNARQLRKVLKTLEELVSGEKNTKDLGFVPDRVTLNILMKWVLRWKDVDSLKIRALFDRLVRNGYPCPHLPSPSAQRQRPRSTRSPPSGPFGTDLNASATSADGFGWGKVKVKMQKDKSFERHVRPLYRMFIKAFYVRGDVYAAKKVVGILKAVQVEESAKAGMSDADGRPTTTEMKN